LAALSLGGIFYYLVCAAIALNFARSRGTTRESELPPVSILKPVRGAEPFTAEAFRSHCEIDYPEYEIIFGVNGGADPAVAAVRQVMAEFPQRKIQLVICADVLGANRKVSNLMQMLPHAAYEHLVIDDGDIRVPKDYLRRLIPPLADENVGLITCLYSGVAANSLGARLEALGISTDFAAGILVARQLEGGLSFGLGSTLALTRAALEKSGGLAPLADYLGDDYELGRRIHDGGFAVKLADFAVQTFIPAYSFGEFVRHQMRWARTIRDSRPGGYAGLIFTFGLPWAMLAVVASLGDAWSWELVGIALVARYVMCVSVAKGVLRDRQLVRDWWLLPLRDALALGIWLASFFGNKITWGESEYILKKGKLTRIKKPARPQQAQASR
jgi:ceramide glucosyltransferase